MGEPLQGIQLLTLECCKQVTKTYSNFKKIIVFSGFKKSGGLIWENGKSIDYLERKKARKSFVVKRDENFWRIIRESFFYVTFLMRVSIFFF